MKIFGRIIFLLLFPFYLFGSANIVVPKRSVIKGDSVTFSIEAIGNDVKFPSIEKIGGFIVTEVGQQQFTSILKGQTISKISKKYSFNPTKSLTIPSFKVIVDKRVVKTKPIKIEVKKATQTKDKYFRLDMFVDKKEAFIGEPIKLTLKFKRLAKFKLANADFREPRMEGFWSKVLTNDKEERRGDFIIDKIEYIIFPQKSGNLEISNAMVDIGIIHRGKDMFSMMIEKIDYKKIYSNELIIKAKPLPKGVSLYGKYIIDVKVDKTTIPENGAVNLIYTIKGYGNIDDIPEISLNIPNTEIFKDKPIILTKIKNSRYYGEYKQKFAIVAENSFYIPSIKLTYFNGKEIITKKSRPIEIKVIKDEKRNDEVVLIKSKENLIKRESKKIVIKESSNNQKLFYILIGFIFGIIFIILLFLLKNNSFKRKKENNSYSLMVKKSRNDRELLNILLPFVHQSKEIDLVVQKLEENLYKGFNHKINKKLLAKRIDNYIKKFKIG